MQLLRRPNPLWLLIGAGFVLYAAAFIYQTSFVVDGERVFTLFDDGMISMRYAKNLAHGFGLVWNPGEAPVEGYTNPLWVLYMAGWHLLPMPATKISAIIQASGAVCLLANLVFVRRIAALLAPGSILVAFGAVLLTALYYPLINWSLQGMEVGVLTLLTSGAVWLALRGLAEHKVSPGMYGLLGLSTLVRPDAAVLFFAMLSFLLVADRGRWRTHLLGGLGTAVLFIGGQTAFRLLYYGAPLPNTYYLKMTGYPTLFRLTRGTLVFAKLLWDMNLGLFLVPLTALIGRRDKQTLLLGWLILVAAGYSIYVGGDAWEWFGGSNRYMSPVMPLLFLLLSVSLWGYLQQLNTDLCQIRPWPPATVRRVINSTLLLALLGVSSIYICLQATPPHPLSLLGLGLAALALLLLGRWLGRGLLSRSQTALAGPPTISRSAVAVMLALIGVSLIELNAVRLSDLSPAAANRWLLQQPPDQGAKSQASVERAIILNRITTPQARVAVVWAGTLPYFLDRPAIDLLGKNDPIIAHETMKEVINLPSYFSFWPGHMKWDYPYSLGQLAPDVVAQLWPSTTAEDRIALEGVPPDAQPYIDAAYTRVEISGIPLYLRRGSPNIRWDVVGGGR